MSDDRSAAQDRPWWSYIPVVNLVILWANSAAWSKRLDVDGPTGLEMESRVIRDQAAADAWTPEPGGFLEQNPHLIENYLAVCAEFGETPGEVPEEVGLLGRERPPEHVFEAFRRIHGLD